MPPNRMGMEIVPRPRPRPAPEPKPSDPAPTPAPRPAKPAVSRKRRTADLLSLISYSALIAIVFVMAANTAIGQWPILAYSLYVLIRRVESYRVFGIALFLLLCIPVLQTFNQSSLADNLAIPVYELLILGTVRAFVELRQK